MQTTPPPPEKIAQQELVIKPKKTWLKGLGLAFLLISTLTLLAYSLFELYRLKQAISLLTEHHQVTLHTQQQLPQIQQSLKQNQIEFKTRLKTLESQLTLAHNNYSQLEQQLLSLKSRWQAAFTSTQLERRIDHLADLLNEAQRQFHLTHSIQLALSSIENALKECLKIQSGTLQRVCQLIRQDHQRLLTAHAPDPAKLLTQLDQLETWFNEGLFKYHIARFETRQSTTETKPSAKTDLAVIPDTLSERWQLALDRLSQFITTHLIKIHHRLPTAENNLLSATLAQTYHHQHAIMLMIQQARNAIIYQDNALYQQALQKIQTFVALYEADFTAYHSDIAQSLQQLQQRSLKIPPNLSFKASHLLNQIRDSLDAPLPPSS